MCDWFACAGPLIRIRSLRDSFMPLRRMDRIPFNSHRNQTAWNRFNRCRRNCAV
ncbi:hypothetical protein C7S17_5876 [Burkholderia thailandensis]|nr:hypothetical protein [Burkholderia thailandensis]